MTGPDLSAFDRDARLRTGDIVHLSPAQEGDEQAIAEFYRRLDDDSTYSRFFGIRRDVPFSELHELTTAPATRCVALLARIGGEVVGVGEFHATDDPLVAEVAFAVSGSHHHEGIATLLLEDLAVIAAHLGFARLTAVTLPSNAAMQLVFRTAGLDEQHRSDQGEVSFTMDLSTLDGLRTQAAGRASIAEGASGGGAQCGSAELQPLR